MSGGYDTVLFKHSAFARDRCINMLLSVNITHFMYWFLIFLSSIYCTVLLYFTLCSIHLSMRYSWHVLASISILISGHSDAQGSASECPDVKNYK